MTYVQLLQVGEGVEKQDEIGVDPIPLSPVLAFHDMEVSNEFGDVW